jgi:hypothetical protein
MSALDRSPLGWFALATSEDLRLRGVLAGVLAGAPYRLRRNLGGRIDASGGVSHVVEQNGFVLGWFHPAGAAPAWHVPVLDERGFRPLRHTLLQARTHPQEVYENSIDTGHFPVIHGYRDISVLRPMRRRGHEMDVSYEIGRAIPLSTRRMTARFEVHLHGIGCAHNHIEVPAFDLRVRMFAMATPTTKGHVDIRLGVTIAEESKLPRALLPLVHRGVEHGIVHDFRQDMVVWENKRYLPRPRLVEGDGPIGAFRAFCRQFYPQEST